MLLVAGASCQADWTTDMWRQPSLGPERAPRPEPEHSIPVGAEPPIADRDEAETLANPVKPDAASVRRGAALFHERCIACHGAEGHGGGPVSRYYPPAPDLAYAAIKARTDGYIFGTVLYGGRAMPPMGEGLTRHEVWDLVNEVRALQDVARSGGG